MSGKIHTTRRAVVACLAAAPVAGLPAAAGAILSDDPIFSAFAVYERAKAADDLAWKAYNDLEEVTASAFEAAGVTPTQILTRRKLESHRELGLLSDAQYDEALTTLDGPESEYQARWRAVEESDESARAAAEERGAAEQELLATAPRTRAGALRLLRHLAEFLDQDDVVNDFYVDDLVGAAIRNAITVFESEARA
ncbi:hypothetical protein C5688_09135 [Methylocystis sp. MitZ-2018]|nr:hypothetical protein C5688_09135 [Methylocystis sp. MitZ-2018]